MHADVPEVRSLYWPMSQALHTEAVVAPVTELKEPGGHAAQADVPEVRPLYEPATQAVHTEEVAAPVTLP